VSRATKADPLGADGAKVLRQAGDVITVVEGVTVVEPYATRRGDDTPLGMARAGARAYYRHHADDNRKRWAHVAYAVYDLARY
jgi:hypothetical protein